MSGPFWPGLGIRPADIIPIDPASVPSYPPTQAEIDALDAINDPAFTSAWNACKYSLTFDWQGDAAAIASVYPLCVAYAQALPSTQKPLKGVKN